MKAIIMAGGFGTRLQPLTNLIPKPMVKIIDTPILEYIVAWLSENGFKDIIMTLGYKPEVIINHFKDGSHLGVKIEYYTEKTTLGTAGGVASVKNFIDDDFLVVSGDAFCDTNLKEFMQAHKTGGSVGTLLLKEMQETKGYGVVKLDKNLNITEFLEKPEFTTEKLVNTGIYAFKKEIFNHIPEGFYDFGTQLFPSLVGALKGHITTAYWNDIGSLSDYYETNLYVANNKEKFKSLF